MKAMVDEVTLGSQEQSKGIEQVSRSIQKMEHVTQSNAAAVEETAGTLEELKTQATLIRGIVEELAVLSGVQASRPASYMDRRLQAVPVR
jgi:methyl-accepting chemotaxis protein